jgi:L-ascorbate metabolism protein UlaG (beta-lactamase superfamily)
MSAMRRPTPVLAELDAIDAVLISHAHPDHFDLASLKAIGRDPLVVVPRGMGPASPGASTWRSCRSVAGAPRTVPIG